MCRFIISSTVWCHFYILNLLFCNSRCHRSGLIRCISIPLNLNCYRIFSCLRDLWAAFCPVSISQLVCHMVGICVHSLYFHRIMHRSIICNIQRNHHDPRYDIRQGHHICICICICIRICVYIRTCICIYLTLRGILRSDRRHCNRHYSDQQQERQ